MSEQPFDFNAYLAKSADDVKRPRPLPGGTYTFLVKERTFGQTTSDKKTPFVEYKVIPQMAEPDVDASELTDVTLTDKELRATFYITKDAEYRLVEFAKHCGVQTQGRKLGEIIDSAVNCYVKATIKQVPNRKDPTAPGYNEFVSFMPAQ